MNKFLTGMIAGASLLICLPAVADVLGETDDSYVGLQMRISLEKKRVPLFSSDNEFSVLLIEKTDGVTDGIAFTQDVNGNRTLGYIKPSLSFNLGQTKVSDYTMPIMTFSGQNRPANNHLTQLDGVGFVIYVVGGAIFLADKLVEIIEDTTGIEDPEETEEGG